MAKTAEHRRLEEARNRKAPWKRWGPYLSERQWGTVREDYSENGDAWNYFSHDHARSRAYRWGEDGLAGISDDRQQLCFALALWNGKDPILKERLFGLTNSESNHGEDVKEYYFYLDSTPTHSYMKYLYKYPQAAYPYDNLVQTSRVRTRQEPEYELLDTGVFDDDRYYDVFVEYAKASPDDILVAITAVNRGQDPATLHLLPTLWFRNTWSWAPFDPKPVVRAAADGAVVAEHHELGTWYLHADTAIDLLFCDNETNAARLWGAEQSPPHPKDAINDCVVGGRSNAVNPERVGTKVAAHTRLLVPAGGSVAMRVRLTSTTVGAGVDPLADADAVIERRLAEADEFYAAITPASTSADAAAVMRQALAGMLWSKQTYYFDVDQWLRERGRHPLRSPAARGTRNESWFHLANHDVISMPDTWEYPWYAAWDLAFHTVPLMMVDPEFAKQQLALMLSPRYLHPSGQIPAYEWNFGDVNPPVHAVATLLVHARMAALGEPGELDLEFLEQSFDRLRTNYTWWVNRKDIGGRSLFEGGQFEGSRCSGSCRHAVLRDLWPHLVAFALD